MSSHLVSLNRKRSDENLAESAPAEAPNPQKTDRDQDEGPIRVTEAAAQEIVRQAIKRGTPHAAVRIGLRGGGCTGYSYVFDWVDGDPKRRDTVIETQGVRLYVDPKSLELLRGMELDFTRRMMGHGFHYNNPNAKGSCGCGAAVQF